MNEDQDGISLLDDFDDDESSLEDPFALGPEGVVRDVLQDELVQRSLSKLSADYSKHNSLADSSLGFRWTPVLKIPAERSKIMTNLKSLNQKHNQTRSPRMKSSRKLQTNR